MIHSLSGGVIADQHYYNFAKVRLDDTDEIRFFIYDIPLDVGDRVMVPVGRLSSPATVLECRTAVHERNAPFPVKHMSYIIKKL